MVTNSYQYRLLHGESCMGVYAKTLSLWRRIKHMLIYISPI